MAAELRFRAMGSDAHAIVVGGRAGLLDVAQRRIEDLEQKWSRFLPNSEITALNEHAGSLVPVSPDTIELVTRSLDAYLLTDGWFDPTVYGALVRAGYDRTIDAVQKDPHRGRSGRQTGAERILVAADAVGLPLGTGFDPGGIGKGLAADIVVDELVADGAAGVCINLGGDVRVSGTGPAGTAWNIAVEHPNHTAPLATLGLCEGAVATSTTLCRQWEIDGETRHHIIDPTTGQPSTTTRTFVSVVTGHAWAAEVMAKVLLLRPDVDPAGVLSEQASALFVDRDGRVERTRGFDVFERAAASDAAILEAVG
jgi:thiamine biosynthesis lipoprotein